MLGPVERQFFQLAFPSPAASHPDFAAFLVLQEIVSGGSGLNLRQSSWSATDAVPGSLLFGTANDVATWLPPTHDPFLFTVRGSIDRKADPAALEGAIAGRLATVRNQPVAERRLADAKAAVTRALAEDVLTTEDAAHQLAFFEGIGALDTLLAMPRHIAAVTAADVQRVARAYLSPDRQTVGWMVPGQPSAVRAGAAVPRPAADRAGAPAPASRAGQPELRRLSGGLPAIVQRNPLSNTATVELLLSAPVEGGTQPAELPGLGAVIRSGPADELAAMVGQAVSATRQRKATPEPRSQDPATRLEQLVAAQMQTQEGAARPLAVIASGNFDPAQAFDLLERQLGRTAPGTSRNAPPRASLARPGIVRERIATPLAQGGIGYVVEAPPPGTREALAWRMLLYVLTHDYSGRLGRSAINDKGIVYYIDSALRTDGARSWATLSTGVDPDKADAMEAELRSQLARLASEMPTAAETEAARQHLLGRDLTAAQSNDELAAKLARNFVETGGLLSHEQLRAALATITPADLAAAARSFGGGTIIRVDVGSRSH